MLNCGLLFGLEMKEDDKELCARCDGVLTLKDVENVEILADIKWHSPQV